MSDSFKRVTEARFATGEAIAKYARFKANLERVRGDRKASAEDIYEAAQECRRSLQEVEEAIEQEVRAITLAEANKEQA